MNIKREDKNFTPCTSTVNSCRDLENLIRSLMNNSYNQMVATGGKN